MVQQQTTAPPEVRYTHRVLRSFRHEGRDLQPGDLVDASGWAPANRATMADARYIAALDASPFKLATQRRAAAVERIEALDAERARLEAELPEREAALGHAREALAVAERAAADLAARRGAVSELSSAIDGTRRRLGERVSGWDTCDDPHSIPFQRRHAEGDRAQAERMLEQLGGAS